MYFFKVPFLVLIEIVALVVVAPAHAGDRFAHTTTLLNKQFGTFNDVQIFLTNNRAARDCPPQA